MCLQMFIVIVETNVKRQNRVQFTDVLLYLFYKI